MEQMLSKGEVADLASIALLKCVQGENTVELQRFLDCLELFVGGSLVVEFRKLLAINQQIWKLESDIRQGKEANISLEEIGRRALKIRDFNNHRVGLKNRINYITGSEYHERKVDHASEDSCLHNPEK